ncbi:MAG: LAGLIDADG family homing endonuclease [Legionellales bacterium]
MRRRYTFKKQYVWDTNLAYIVGLISSDGCLINNGRHLNVTSKDDEIIQNVQRILNMCVKVPIKISSHGGSAYHLQFSNVALYDFLLTIGLTPAKSKTIGPLTIPNEYYADFLRGYFDGDGSVYGYWDKRWSNSLMYYVGFTSSSQKLLLWLQLMNTELVGTSSGSIKPSVGASVLNYAKADSQKIFSFIYYTPNLPKLTRKYMRFVAFLQTDPYAGKELRARVLESVDRPA